MFSNMIVIKTDKIVVTVGFESNGWQWVELWVKLVSLEPDKYLILFYIKVNKFEHNAAALRPNSSYTCKDLFK